MGNIGGARVTKSVERLEYHDPRVRVDSRHAHAIAAIGGDDPGGNRAVAVMVPRLVVVSQKIPADDVVDIAVAVVVDAVARRLARILPDIGPIEIGVVPVEPAVDDRDDDRPGIGAELGPGAVGGPRSEEHTHELQSLMRTSYAVFC